MRWGPAAAAMIVLASCAPDGDAAIDTGPTTTPAPINLPEPSTSTTTTPAGTSPPTSPPTSDPPTTPSPSAASTTAPAPTTTTTPPATTTTTLPPDPLPPNSQFDGLELALELVADVEKPTAVAWRDGDPAMFVATQAGPIHRVLGDEITTVIDLTAETFEALPGSERGVLGLAFDPRDGRMFVNMTDVDHDTRVISFQLDDTHTAIPGSRREVLFIDQPGLGHNGGKLVFDADGNLLISSGDGGASNGWDAQDTTKLLGALLRVTPRLDGDGYDIPPDNPFADGVADRPEILARGFRNPWGFSLDDDTGDIWIGDVGNNSYEEVSLLRRDQWGANFGWPYFEGDDRRRNQVPVEVVPPVYSYSHGVGVAVIGGVVYRGSEIPALRGAYLFGDFSGPVWAIGSDGVTGLDIPRLQVLTGWAEGPDGEIYVMGLRDGVQRVIPAAAAP